MAWRTDRRLQSSWRWYRGVGIPVSGAPARTSAFQRATFAVMVLIEALILARRVTVARASWVVLAVLALGACAESSPGDDSAGGGSSGSGAADVDGSVRCTYAYRASNEVMAGQTGDEALFELEERSLSVGRDEDASERLGQLTFGVSYRAEEFNSETISISAGDGEGRVLSILYQLGDGLPQNQFVGGHGFTGLLYFTHPTEGGDYQAFCEAVR